MENPSNPRTINRSNQYNIHSRENNNNFNQRHSNESNKVEPIPGQGNDSFNTATTTDSTHTLSPLNSSSNFYVEHEIRRVEDVSESSDDESDQYDFKAAIQKQVTYNLRNFACLNVHHCFFFSNIFRGQIKQQY